MYVNQKDRATWIKELKCIPDRIPDDFTLEGAKGWYQRKAR